jgi:hypothetical protein
MEAVLADAVKNPDFIRTSQYKVTASAVALPSQSFNNGLVLKAKSANVGKVFLGGSAVTTTDDGTGTGFALAAGESVSIGVTDAASIYVIGTANDVLYILGN